MIKGCLTHRIGSLQPRANHPPSQGHLLINHASFTHNQSSAIATNKTPISCFFSSESSIPHFEASQHQMADLNKGPYGKREGKTKKGKKKSLNVDTSKSSLACLDFSPTRNPSSVSFRIINILINGII